MKARLPNVSIRYKRPKKTVAIVKTGNSCVLRLFVAGATDRSHQAVLRVKRLCNTTLVGRVRLDVIDIYQQPALAYKHQIVATPTLIIQLPMPVRRFIGNLTNIADLFSLLDLDKKGRVTL